MKVNFNVEIDTDNEDDLELVEEVLYLLQDIKELTETPKQNLNRRNNNTKKKVMQ